MILFFFQPCLLCSWSSSSHLLRSCIGRWVGRSSWFLITFVCGRKKKKKQRYFSFISVCFDFCFCRDVQYCARIFLCCFISVQRNVNTERPQEEVIKTCRMMYKYLSTYSYIYYICRQSNLTAHVNMDSAYIFLG